MSGTKPRSLGQQPRLSKEELRYFAKKAMEVVEEKASVKEVGEEEASPWEEG